MRTHGVESTFASPCSGDAGVRTRAPVGANVSLLANPRGERVYGRHGLEATASGSVGVRAAGLAQYDGGQTLMAPASEVVAGLTRCG